MYHRYKTVYFMLNVEGSQNSKTGANWYESVSLVIFIWKQLNLLSQSTTVNLHSSKSIDLFVNYKPLSKV